MGFLLPCLGLVPALLAPDPAPRTPSPGAPHLAGPRPGPWRAWLDSPGGELPFGLELEHVEGRLAAVILNGPERLEVPHVELDGDRLVLHIDVYDSRIEATCSAGGDALEGLWTKRSGPDSLSRLDFHARAGEAPRFGPPAGASLEVPVEASSAPLASDGAHPSGGVAGRWAVDFESDELPAVGVFEAGPGNTVTGTFLTATGDYRYLAGTFQDRRLRLSVFDGAHAFLFDARLRDDGTLEGDFWSRDTWHETWTARRDPEARVVDAFDQTVWDERASLADLVLPDLTGRSRSLAEPELAGNATVLQLFGSWCPNCNDETAYLVELYERYAGRGLSILGLAFELTGDFERDAHQVRLFAEHHRVPFPLFLAGTAGKSEASAAFPAIDRLRSYPTTIFLDANGRVRSVHSGFAGPATGEAHARLRHEFEALIEELLAEAADGRTAREHEEASWSRLVAAGDWHAWFEPRDTLRFLRGPSGEQLVELKSAEAPVARPRQLSVRLQGDAVWLGDQVLRFEAERALLLDPRDPGRRFRPAAAQGAPRGTDGSADLSATDALERREALFHLAAERGPTQGLPEALPLLEDPQAGVALAAAWALGHCGELAAVEPLLERLTHPNAALRRTAIRALGRLRPEDPAVRTAIEPLLEDPDPLVRAAARDVVAPARR